jgi:hypothetical protein
MWRAGATGGASVRVWQGVRSSIVFPGHRAGHEDGTSFSPPTHKRARGVNRGPLNKKKYCTSSSVEVSPTKFAFVSLSPLILPLSGFFFLLRNLMATLLFPAAVAAATYLNAKFSLSLDLQQMRNDREWNAAVDSTVARLGQNCTLYHLFDRVDPGIEALWFEGKSWTYGQLKNGEYRRETFR